MVKKSEVDQQRQFKLNTGFITQKMGDKVTIFYGEKSLLFTLNDTAAFIFNGLKMSWPQSKIVDRLSEKYKIDKKTAKADIAEFTEKLVSKNVISPK